MTGCTGCGASTSGWSSSSSSARTGVSGCSPARARWSRRATGSWCATPERKTTTIKSDVDHRIPELVQLASAEAIFEYRPIDVVGRIAPRATMIICVENDCDDARGPRLRAVRAGRQPEATGRPDRNDALRRVRAVPPRGRADDRRLVRALPRGRGGRRSASPKPATRRPSATSTARPGRADA